MLVVNHVIFYVCIHVKCLNQAKHVPPDSYHFFMMKTFKIPSRLFEMYSIIICSNPTVKQHTIT
jgi:hypothetical protein